MSRSSRSARFAQSLPSSFGYDVVDGGVLGDDMAPGAYNNTYADDAADAADVDDADDADYANYADDADDADGAGDAGDADDADDAEEIEIVNLTSNVMERFKNHECGGRKKAFIVSNRWMDFQDFIVIGFLIMNGWVICSYNNDNLEEQNKFLDENEANLLFFYKKNCK